MKKTQYNFVSIFAVLVTLFFVSACNDPKATFTDKFSEIAPVTMPVNDVVEIFSLTCGHCKNLENVLARIEDTSDIEFQKTHVVFGENTLRFAYLFYAAEIQFKENKSRHFEFMGELFELVQTDFNSIPAEEKTKKIGVLFESFGMQSPQSLNESQYVKIKEKAEFAIDLSGELKLGSVPAILIKGKYLIDMNGHKNAEELKATINYLLKK